jgi:ATP adenylyltransferase
MAYIGRDTSQDDEGCFLCAKSRQQDDEANLILARGTRGFVIMNLYPYNSGHLMIAPYAHVPSIEELDAPTLTELMVLAQRCLAALRTALHPDGFNLGFNLGKVAGAGLADHVHLHVVPRWNGDTNFMPVLADVKVMPDLLQNTYRQIRAALTPLMEPAEPAASTDQARPRSRGGGGSPRARGRHNTGSRGDR